MTTKSKLRLVMATTYHKEQIISQGSKSLNRI